MYAVSSARDFAGGLGLNSLFPAHLRWTVLPAIAASFAAIDLYGVHFLLAPYYTG